MASNTITSSERKGSSEGADFGYSRSNEQSKRMSRWASIIYVAVALATPLLVVAGPVVMSPTAPLIADAALEGHLSLHPQALHAVATRTVEVR